MLTIGSVPPPPIPFHSSESGTAASRPPLGRQLSATAPTYAHTNKGRELVQYSRRSVGIVRADVCVCVCGGVRSAYIGRHPSHASAVIRERASVLFALFAS